MSRTLLNERLSNLRQDQKEPRKHTKAAPGGTRHWLGESNHCILGRCYQSKAKIANLFLKMGWNKLKKWPLEVEHLLQSWKKSPDSSALTAKSSRTPPRCISFAKMNLVRLLCLSWTNLDSRWCRGRYSWHRWLLSEEDMCPIAAVVETFLAQQEDGRGYEVDLDGLWAFKAIWDKMFRKEM